MNGKKPANPSGPKPSGKPAGEPAAKPSTKPSTKPAPQATGFMNWLGRQVGHVKKAVKTDVTKPPAGKAAPRPAPDPQAAPADPAPKIIYRDGKVEEIDHPTQPGVKLRRTVIDEVIVDEKEEKGE